MNQRDEVLRKYLIRGPCQPCSHTFEQTSIGNTLRRFNPARFDRFRNCLEYSVKKTFCLCCYLFRDNSGKCVRSDAFIIDGYCSWNKLKCFTYHVEGVDSFHNNAVMKCEKLMNQGQSIKHVFHKHDDIAKNEYRIRLNASIDAAKYLL